MEIDVIIPAMRATFIAQVLYSFSKNTVAPGMITIVSNEISKDIPTFELRVRLVRFTSAHYPIGRLDTALRRNIGIWSSPCSHVITFDDDQLAPVNLVETSAALLRRQPYFWGNYRYIDFSRYAVDELITLPAHHGRSREMPPNAWHLWLSSYGGLFGAERRLVEQLGGYDLIFLGRHAGEDQNLGKRLAERINHTERIFVHEPPFAWHPETRMEWSPPRYSNLCRSEHQFSSITLGGITIKKCRACPYFEPPQGPLYRDPVLIPFDPDKVDVIIEELGRGR